MKKIFLSATCLLLSLSGGTQSKFTEQDALLLVSSTTRNVGTCTSCTGTLRKNENTGKNFCDGAPKDCNFSSGD